MTGTISDSLTEEQLAAATTANRAILQERFPDLDLSVGGPVDSTLVDGNVAVTARNQVDVDTAYVYQQLQAISLGEVEVEDEVLDQLMANYFLTRQSAIVASGTVRLVVSDNLQQTFSAGSTLFYSGLQYQVTQTFTVYPVGTTGVDLTKAGNLLKEEVYDDETGFQYQFRLPISSILASPSTVRVSGDRFDPGSGFDFATLGYIEAVTNFSGGQAAETNQQFAARGLSGLLARTVGGNDHINSLVTDTVQLADSNSLGAGSPMMTRDRDNVFNIPTGGKVDTYFKAGAVASRGFEVDAVVVDDALRTARITLTRAQSSGVYRLQLLPLYTAAPPEITAGSLAVDLISHDTWTDTSPGAFNPTMPAAIDRAFSSRQQIVIDLTDDREDASGYIVDMAGGPGTVLSGVYQVSQEYQPQLEEVDAVLLGYENRPPGTDILTKAAVPCITTVGLVAARPADYNGPDADALAAEIASAINLLPISTTQLDATVLAGILRAIEPTLTFQSSALNATIYGQDGVNISLAPIGGVLTIPTNTTAKVSPYNTYFTTDAGRVTVSLV